MVVSRMPPIRRLLMLSNDFDPQPHGVGYGSFEAVSDLNSLLATELAAVNSYTIAINEMQNDLIKFALIPQRDSHAERVGKLTAAVHHLDGSPTEDSGMDGAFEAMILNSAHAEVDTLACLALTESERLLKYERLCMNTSEIVREMIETELLPAQRLTCDAVSKILKCQNGPAPL
jgi:hypothetical protein